MKDPRCMTVREAAEFTGATESFIRQAIKNGTFPGSYTADGKRSAFHIPRRAVEDYMDHWSRPPSGELIDALYQAYVNSLKSAH